MPWAVDPPSVVYTREEDEEGRGSGEGVWRRGSGGVERGGGGGGGEGDAIRVERMEVVVPPAEVVEVELAQMRARGVGAER